METVNNNTRAEEEGLPIDENIIKFITVVETLPIPGLSEVLSPLLSIVGLFEPDPIEKLQETIAECNTRILNLSNVLAVVIEKNELTYNLSATITTSKQLNRKLQTQKAIATKKGQDIPITEVKKKIDQFIRLFEANETNVKQYLKAYSDMTNTGVSEFSSLTEYVEGFNFGYQIISEQYLLLADAARDIIYFYEENKGICDQDAWDIYIENTLNVVLKKSEIDYEELTSKEIRNQYLPETLQYIYNGGRICLELTKPSGSYRFLSLGDNEHWSFARRLGSEEPFPCSFKVALFGENNKDATYDFLLILEPSGKWLLRGFSLDQHIRVPHLNFNITFQGLFLAVSDEKYFNQDFNDQEEIPWLVEYWDISYNPIEDTFRFLHTNSENETRGLRRHNGNLEFNLGDEDTSDFKIISSI